MVENIFNCSIRLIWGLGLISIVVYEYNEYWFFCDFVILNMRFCYIGYVFYGLWLCDWKVLLLIWKMNGVELFVYVNMNSFSDGLIFLLSYENYI